MAYLPGPFDSPHVYVQWGGKLPGGEQWSCGLRMRNKGTGALTNDAAVLDAITVAVEAYHTNSLLNISQRATLNHVKANVIGTDGHYVASTTLEHTLADIPGGGPAGQAFPNQVALAVSLTTGFSRGPAHRGRFYLPLVSYPLNAIGEIDVGQQDNVKNATTALLTALNTASSALEVAVFSRKLGSAGNRRVTGVQVGAVYDTQRRRRKSMVEAYR